MIRLLDLTLPGDAQKKLDEYQGEIDAIIDYATRVEQAKASFSSRNRRGNATFDAIKETLLRVHGAGFA